MANYRPWLTAGTHLTFLPMLTSQILVSQRLVQQNTVQSLRASRGPEQRFAGVSKRIHTGNCPPLSLFLSPHARGAAALPGSPLPLLLATFCAVSLHMHVLRAKSYLLNEPKNQFFPEKKKSTWRSDSSVHRLATSPPAPGPICAGGRACVSPTTELPSRMLVDDEGRDGAADGHPGLEKR